MSDHKWDRFKRAFGGKPSDALIGVRDGKVKTALGLVAVEIKRVTDAGLDPAELKRRHDTIEQARVTATGLDTNGKKSTALDTVKDDARQLAKDAPGLANAILQENTDLGVLAGQRDGRAKASLANVALQIKRVTDAAGDPGTLKLRHDTIEQARADALKLGSNRAKAAALEKVEGDAQKLAGEAVGLADGILRAPSEKRRLELVSALGTIPGRIAGLTKAPPPGVGQALKLCTDKRDAAEVACKASPFDAGAADTALTHFKDATGALGVACLDGAGVLGKDFSDRFTTTDKGKPAGKAIIKAYADLADARKAFDAEVTGKDGLGALEAAGAVETALAAFETAAAPSDKDKKATAKKAFETLGKLKDEELDKKSLEEKALLALELCANGTPNDYEEIPKSNPKRYRPKKGGMLDEICRLYKHSAPDPKFMDKRAEQREQIADELVKMDEVKKLYKENGDLDDKYWKKFTSDSDKVLKLMQKVCDIQADAMGMGKIVVSKAPDPPEKNGTMGGYDPATNSISLNFHPDYLKPVSEAFDTIIHETFHAHQDAIVKRLKAGGIKPGDDEYATALMYMVNDIPVGYVFGATVGNENYKTQPTEFDSFHHAEKTVESLLGKAKATATKVGA